MKDDFLTTFQLGAESDTEHDPYACYASPFVIKNDNHSVDIPNTTKNIKQKKKRKNKKNINET